MKLPDRNYEPNLVYISIFKFLACDPSSVSQATTCPKTKTTTATKNKQTSSWINLKYIYSFPYPDEY